MKYLLIAYFAFANPTIIDTFEGEVAYKQCMYMEGENRWLYRNDPTAYIICLQSAEI